jgi:hypothetical protein
LVLSRERGNRGEEENEESRVPIGLTSLTAMRVWTTIKAAGASVAITARIPYLSTKPPNKGERQAEMMYGMDMTVEAALIPSA